MKILLHIPHTSLKVPRRFYRGLQCSKQDFKYYNKFMTDYKVDKLFKGIKAKRIKAKYSRLYCDVEKFKDAALEPMSKLGQGVIYTETYDQMLLHKHEKKYEAMVFKYYDKYHHKLDKMALELLKKDSFLLILDCHSFDEKMALTHHKGPFPDVCIGIEKSFYDEKVANEIIEELKKRNLSYKINYPYEGSMVPNIIFKKKYEGKVVSIMLEVNKRVYLNKEQ